MTLGIMEVHFSSYMPSCICHMERNICDNFTLRFRDEESDGVYSDLDLETNGSDPDIYMYITSKIFFSQSHCFFSQYSGFLMPKVEKNQVIPR